MSLSSLGSGNFVWLSFPMYFAVNIFRFTVIDVKSPMLPKKKNWQNWVFLCDALLSQLQENADIALENGSHRGVQYPFSVNEKVTIKVN